jgi:hypothetical protein
MKRSRFILIATAAAAGFALPVINYRCRNSIPGSPLLRPGTLACFCDEETIREIGNDYISMEQYGQKAKKRLEEKIMKGYNGQFSSKSGSAEISDWIEKKIQEDFINQRIVTVNGWILSETEACQCALLSLS